MVLSGGGARAAYQVGALSAIAERLPNLTVPVLSGVSAGAINTVTIAAHPGNFSAKMRALRREWQRLTVDQVYRIRLGGVARGLMRWAWHRLTWRAKGPAVVRGVMDMEPLRQFLTARVSLVGIQSNIAAGRLNAVTLSTTCYDTGETISFVQGAIDTPMWQRAQRRSVRTTITWDHVMASAAIPILFPAVKVDNLYHGDGSVRQAAPLAPAIHLGAERILAVAMRPGHGDAPVRELRQYPSAARVMGMLFHSIFLDSLDTDSERVERLNVLLDACPPTEDRRKGLRPIDLLVVRPSLDLGALARPHFNRLPTLMRSLVNSIGGHQEGAADFVSYLLFDPAYTGPLMELGYDDVMDDWDRIERFLAGERSP
jgi:NTE family protein